MQTKYKQRKFFVALGQWMIVCAMIISCNSMWITLAPHDNQVKNLALVMILVGIFIAILASGALYKTKKLVLGVAYMGVFAAYLMVWLFVTDFAHKAFLKVALVFLALLLYYFLVEENDEIPKVLIRYDYLITAIAVFSIVCWLVFSVFKLFPAGEPGMTWWNGTDHYTKVKSFYGIYFQPQMKKIFGIRIARNCGFFTEAPMASLHFSFAFLIDLFLQKKLSKARAVILALAVATTFSSTGYIVVAAAIVIRIVMAVFHSEKYARMEHSSKNAVKVLMVLILIALAIVCFMLVKNRVGGESWRIRMEDFKAAFLAWFDRPLFGNGIYNFDAIKVHFHASRAANPGFSSTTALGTILADGGAAFGLLYVGSFVCAIIKAVKNWEFNVLFFAVLVFLIFAVTIVAYDYITIFMFLFFGAYRCRSRKHFEKKLA